jgi:hypothetical protein
LTVGRPIQLLALVGLLAALAGGAALTLQHNSPSATPPIVEPRAKVGHKTPAVVATPSTHTSVRPQPVKHAPALVAANGLPMVLATALRKHRIVVVSLVDPQSLTDAVSFAEARAGAAAAHVGFLSVSVLDANVAGPLTTLLPGGGLLPDPGLLIYRRPGSLVQRINGFADRDAVAQAAAGATTAPVLGAATP